MCVLKVAGNILQAKGVLCVFNESCLYMKMKVEDRSLSILLNVCLLCKYWHAEIAG